MKNRTITLSLIAGIAAFCIGAALLSENELKNTAGRELTTSDVVGVWEGSKGGRVEIKPGGKVTLIGIHQNPSCLSSEERSHSTLASGEGAWTPDRYRDEAPGDRIDYKPSNPASDRQCTIWMAWAGTHPNWIVYFLHDDAHGERFKRQ